MDGIGAGSNQGVYIWKCFTGMAGENEQRKDGSTYFYANAFRSNNNTHTRALAHAFTVCLNFSSQQK